MPVKTETIRELQVLSQGRAPAEQSSDHLTDVNGTPSDDSDGFDLAGLSPRPILAFVGVTLQAVPEAFDAVVTVLTAVEGDTYRITFDAVNYDYVAQPGDGVAEIATGLVASVGAATAAKATPADNGDGTITFTGVKGQTYTIAVEVPAGTGTMSVAKDATTVDWRVWGYAPGRGWHLIPDTARSGVTTNEMERFTVSGLERLYVEITATDGRVRPLVQAALLETE